MHFIIAVFFNGLTLARILDVPFVIKNGTCKKLANNGSYRYNEMFLLCAKLFPSLKQTITPVLYL